MPTRDNAHAWYEYARTTGDDAVAKFMMRWIAFNFLYSEFRRSDDGAILNERKQIERLCEARYNKLSRYDPFEDSNAISIFIELPVLRGEEVPERRRGPHLPRDTSKAPNRMNPFELWGMVNYGSNLQRVQCLLLTIYQVRCNLFHGEKSPDYPRDKRLVQSSATIMKGYIETLLGIDATGQIYI